MPTDALDRVKAIVDLFQQNPHAAIELLASTGRTHHLAVDDLRNIVQELENRRAGS